MQSVRYAPHHLHGARGKDGDERRVDCGCITSQVAEVHVTPKRVLGWDRVSVKRVCRM